MSVADPVRKPTYDATPGRAFIFTDEHQALRESIRSFVDREVVPHVMEWEETTFPDAIVKRMGDLGLLGLSVPEDYGAVLLPAVHLRDRVAYERGEYNVREISMAKLQASQVAHEVADQCAQIHGGAGYMKEYEIERVARDIRLYRIGAGADEILLDVIGKSYGS